MSQMSMGDGWMIRLDDEGRIFIRWKEALYLESGERLVIPETEVTASQLRTFSNRALDLLAACRDPSRPESPAAVETTAKTPAPAVPGPPWEPPGGLERRGGFRRRR